jgi:hypothetical protein
MFEGLGAKPMLNDDLIMNLGLHTASKASQKIISKKTFYDKPVANIILMEKN